MRPEAAIRAISDDQLHLATRRQLLAAGLTDDQIQHSVRTELLRPLHRGVYLTAGETPSFEQRALAACLACGEGAHVAGRSAAILWGYTETFPSLIDIAVPPTRTPRVNGVCLLRRRLHPRLDRTVREAVPVTTPLRTLLDLAGLVAYEDLERACDEAFKRPSVSPDRLLTYLRRDDLRFARGIAALRAIARDRSGRGVPESVLECVAIRVLRSHGLPEPVRQFTTRVSGRVVRFDLAYPDDRVAIELDGRAPHWGRDAWQSDHDRHNATELGGWRVLRFTWWDVNERPGYVVLVVADALDVRPRSWTRRKSHKAIAK